MTQQKRRRFTLQETYEGTNYSELIPMPDPDLNPERLKLCKDLFRELIEPGCGALIPDSRLTLQKWCFLEYLVKHEQILLHGSTSHDIEVFEPRAAIDNLVGGERALVYAASSGILASFFAIHDRAKLEKLGLAPGMNVCYFNYEEQGAAKEGFHFAIDYRALRHFHWSTGMVYILPRGPFRADFQQTQWFSEVPVRPLAKILVHPHDFPILASIRGTDFGPLVEQFERVGMQGYPWLHDARIHPRR
ncbi:MAG TPA: hypothetical protein VEJ63_22505 [Planctomycetota bacterium]|nr:hypothetical protein [Planctomycetota bacterium]